MTSPETLGLPAEFTRILTILVEHDVEFVVVGGIGAILRGVPRPPLDVDVAPEQSDENLLRMTRALVALEAEVMGAGKVRNFPIGDWLRASRFWNFTTTLGRFDVLLSVDGVDGYDTLARDATSVPLSQEVSVMVASVDHLIAMKEAAGRDKDQLVLPSLYWLRDRPQGPPPVEP